jgi:hypothetical protein
MQVKTELSIQTFRDRPMNVGQAEVVLNTVFQGENSAEDYARWGGWVGGGVSAECAD